MGRSRSLLHQSENTLSGLEDLFLLPFQPSKKCGLEKTNMTKLAQPSSTESALKRHALVKLGEAHSRTEICVGKIKRNKATALFCLKSLRPVPSSAWSCTGLCEDGLKNFDGIVEIIQLGFSVLNY